MLKREYSNPRPIHQSIKDDFNVSESMLRFDDRHDLRGNSNQRDYGSMPDSIDKSLRGRRRRERKRINVPSLPPMGQPGGLDDHRRNGLSGAGIRWYLRYLFNGYSPDEARQKAEEHRTTSTPNSVNAFQKRINDSTAVSNRDRKIPKLDNVVTEQDTTLDNENDEHIALVPQNYPQETITDNELMHLENAIITEIARGCWDAKLKFNSIIWKPSMLLIGCETQETADWLRNILQSMEKWKGPRLVAYWEDELPEVHVIYVTFPNKFKRSLEVIYSLIKAQNDGINTDSWKVLESEQPGSFLKMTILIDEKSKNALAAADFKLFFMFSKVKVKYRNELPAIRQVANLKVNDHFEENKQQEEEVHVSLQENGQFETLECLEEYDQQEDDGKLEVNENTK